MTLFEEFGGESALREIVNDFVDRCRADTMIGFLFARAELDRIKRHEYEHAAHHLGADVQYRGRPLDEAHRPHRILGGQFDRRRTILIQTLRDHDAPQHLVDSWITHQDALRPLITKDPDSNCQD